MYKRYFILVIVFIFTHSISFSQELNVGEVDRKTFQLYQEKNWKELIKEGKEALNQGLDFFYLRMRLGIAFYEQKNYLSAIPHFRKALTFNDEDKFAQEYYYFALLYSGQALEARKYAATLPTVTTLAWGYKPEQVFHSLSMQYTFSQNMDHSLLDNYTFNGNSSAEGSQIILRDFHLFNVGLTHRIGKSTSVYHQYSYLYKDQLLYERNATSGELFPSRELMQNQYYLRINTALGMGWDMAFYIHYLHVSDAINTSSQGWQGGNFSGETSVRQHDYVAGFQLQKQWGLIKLAFSTSFSGIREANQWQQHGAFIFYPLGNLNVYTVSGLYHHTDHLGEPYATGYWVYQQTVGWKAWTNTWFELYGAWGQSRNFFSQNAMYVYNTPETVKNMFGANGIFSLFNHALQVRLGYHVSSLESSFYDIATQEDINIKKYNVQNISGGILWNF